MYSHTEISGSICSNRTVLAKFLKTISLPMQSSTALHFYFCQMDKQEVIVIGGGAAGYFCAVNAARMNPDLRVTILEKSNKVLSKVRISGGGRCNVTHACFDIGEMVKRYPRGGNFVKKTFHQFF